MGPRKFDRDPAAETGPASGLAHAKRVFTFPFLACGVLAALLMGCATQADLPASRYPDVQWIDAFQSSPVPSSLPDSVPAQIREQMDKMRPPQTTGTVRYRIAVAAEGNQLRVRLSNEHGDAPLRIAAASVALAGEGFDALPSSTHVLTFGGAGKVSIGPGAVAISDPVALPTQVLTELLVSVHVPDGYRPSGFGALAIAPGDATQAAHMPGANEGAGRSIVSGVLVAPSRPTSVVVALGDSITDGGLASWPAELQRRLSQADSGFAVINAGIAGNTVLSGGFGLTAQARLERDVLRAQGISHIVMLEGINDISSQGKTMMGEGRIISVDELTAGYRQIIARAHVRGIKVIGGTILPFAGAAAYSAEKDVMRRAVNDWIRTSGAFDGVIDFEAAMKDPGDPLRLRPEYDSGDHLHPNARGQKAMGETIDLRVFN